MILAGLVEVVDVFDLSFRGIMYPGVGTCCDNSSSSRNVELVAAVVGAFVNGLSTGTSGPLYPVPDDFFRSYFRETLCSSPHFFAGSSTSPSTSVSLLSLDLLAWVPLRRLVPDRTDSSWLSSALPFDGVLVISLFQFLVCEAGPFLGDECNGGMFKSVA